MLCLELQNEEQLKLLDLWKLISYLHTYLSTSLKKAETYRQL